MFALRRWGIPALALLVAAGVGFWMGKATNPPSIEIVLPSNRSSSSADLRVDVKGAVQAPGVYLLAPNARITDAVEAAGGPAEDADLAQLNLAAKVTDEGLVVVPRRGELLPGAAPSGLLVNINTATEADLRALPGIGDVRARQIVSSRSTDGPFSDPLDLLVRNLVTSSVFERIKSNITVR